MAESRDPVDRTGPSLLESQHPKKASSEISYSEENKARYTITHEES